jgi:hypothetical protein
MHYRPSIPWPLKATPRFSACLQIAVPEISRHVSSPTILAKVRFHGIDF